MSDKDDGGNAYPWGGDIRGGMTLRDYFAGQALASLAATAVSDNSPILQVAVRRGVDVDDLIAQMSYEYADALIKARKA